MSDDPSTLSEQASPSLGAAVWATLVGFTAGVFVVGFTEAGVVTAIDARRYYVRDGSAGGIAHRAAAAYAAVGVLALVTATMMIRRKYRRWQLLGFLLGVGVTGLLGGICFGAGGVAVAPIPASSSRD